jgi:hypothetical protein
LQLSKLGPLEPLGLPTPTNTVHKGRRNNGNGRAEQDQQNFTLSIEELKDFVRHCILLVGRGL